MPRTNLLTSSAEGQAALSICESMLIALADLKVMSVQETKDILKDAATAHRDSGGSTEQMIKHEQIAVVIERIRTTSNSVPR